MADDTEKRTVTGRPSSFTQETADVICERIANGESLRLICDDDDMPDKATVFRWLKAEQDFCDQYARAREAQADTLFDEILHISNTPVVGEKTKTDKDGNVETSTGDMIEHRRLQIETRKWMAGKLKPKKYGEKLDLNVSGSLETASEEQIDARIAQLLGKAGTHGAAGGAGTPEEAE